MIQRRDIVQYLIYGCLVILGIGLFRTQVVQGNYYRQLSEQNRIRLIPLEASRGRVFDRQNRLLATNRPSYDLVATPEDVTPEVFFHLPKILNLSEETIRERMSSRREYPFAPALIQQDIPKELAFRIEELRPELPGVFVRVSGLRYYPYHEIASHLIGYIGKINPYEYKIGDRRKYGLTSLVGRAGLEKIFDENLRGWRGGRQIEVDARGRLIRVMSEKKPEPGEDLHVTLDLEFQKAISQLIQKEHATVAVLDLETEGLLALASQPGYDPNVFVAPGLSSQRMEILKDPSAPMLNRAASAAYPPGSVFKLVTALTALEKGVITPETRFFCPGHFQLKPGTRKYRCWYEDGHGSLNLYEAIERSCNVYFYELGKRLSPNDIAKYARELGLGFKMDLNDWKPVTKGLVPDSSWKWEKYKEKWYQGETLSYAIGQSYLLTSPLQILKLVSIIANEGKNVEMNFVEKKEPSKKRQIAIQRGHLKTIKRAMLRVVESRYGTGQLARVQFAKMAAKTGTAQVPPHEAHSWLAGFFPYEDPKIAFVVFVEHGGSGGVTGGKIAKQVVQLWEQYYGVAMG